MHVRSPAIPLWLKIGYTIWLIVWTVLHAQIYPTVHFLWLCHIGNFILAVAFWRESALLFSWQAVSLLLADLIWVLDASGRLLFGTHLIGGTEYVFNTELSLVQRRIALFHVAMPILLICALYRFGYDRRAIWYQLGTVLIVFPISYWLGPEAENINWVYGPFAQVQHTVPPLAYLFVSMILYPLVVFIPSHLILVLVAPRVRSNAVTALTERSASPTTAPP